MSVTTTIANSYLGRDSRNQISCGESLASGAAETEGTLVEKRSSIAVVREELKNGRYDPLRYEWLTKSQTFQCQLLFIMIGTSAMYYWNCALNTLYSVVVVKHPNDIQTITNVYTVMAVISAFALSVCGASRPWMHFVGGGLLAVMCVLFPLFVCHCGDGKTSMVLLHISSAVAGTGEMLFQCSGYAFAVLLNKRFAGYISFGYGACGVVTFAIWMILSEGIWPLSAGSSHNMTCAVWMQFCLGSVFIAGSMVGTYRLLQLPQMKERLKLSQRNVTCETSMQGEIGRNLLAAPSQLSIDDATKEVTVDIDVRDHSSDVDGVELAQGPKLSGTTVREGPTSGRVGQYSIRQRLTKLWPIFRDTWQMQIGLGICQGISMMAYPLIGPYQFNLSVRRNDILTGIFQCGDFVGRYIPNLAPLIPILLLPARWMLPLTLVRGVLLALFIYIAKLTAEGQTSHVLTHYGTQVVLMAALALSHGYYGSIFMIRMTENLSAPAARVQASAMAVCLLVACIAIGMGFAQLVKF